jgi:hypothetical protein
MHERTIDKSNLCIAISRAMLPKKATEVEVEDQAVALMRMTEAQVQATYRRIFRKDPSVSQTHSKMKAIAGLSLGVGLVFLFAACSAAQDKKAAQTAANAADLACKIVPIAVNNPDTKLACQIESDVSALVNNVSALEFTPAAAPSGVKAELKPILLHCAK